MGKHLSLLGAASMLSLAFISPALAAPVTSADLEGKKICWENSLGKNVATYGPGDKYSSTSNGKGTWTITKLGVEVHVDGNFPYQRYAQEKLPDGTLTSQLLYPTGLDLRSTGKYCK